MYRIKPSLSQNIYPGSGYNYILQTTSKSPFILTKNLGSEDNKEHFVSKEYNNYGLTVIPNILYAIKTNQKNLLHSEEIVNPLNAAFTEKNQNFLNIFTTVSLSQLYKNIGLNGPDTLRTITTRQSELTKIKFHADYIPFFIKKKTELYTWEINNPDELCFQPTNSNTSLFEDNFGDCYLTKINFGRESLIQMDLKKDKLEEFNLTEKDIDIALKLLLSKKMGLEDINNKDLKMLLQDENLKINAIKVNKQNENKKWNLRYLISYITSHDEISSNHPTVIDAEVNLYTKQSMENSKINIPHHLQSIGTNDLWHRFDGIQRHIDDFETKFVSNCADLFQSLNFLQDSAELSQTKTDSQKFDSISREIEDQLKNVKKYLSDLQQGKLALSSLPAVSSSIPLAADLLQPLMTETHPKESDHSKDTIQFKPIDSFNNTFQPITKTETALNTNQFKRSTGFNPHLLTTEVTSYVSNFDMINFLRTKTSHLTGTLSSTKMPKYYAKASHFNDDDTFSFLKNEPGHAYLGPGILMDKLPQSANEWSDYLYHYQSTHGRMPRLFRIVESEDDLYETGPLHLKTTKVVDYGEKPRAVSVSADGLRFFFHLGTKKSVSDYSEAYTVGTLENPEVFDELAELEKKSEENQRNLQKKSEDLVNYFTKINKEKLWLPSEIVNDSELLIQLRGEMANLTEIENKTFKKDLVAAQEECVKVIGEIKEFEEKKGYQMILERFQNTQKEYEDFIAQMEYQFLGFRNPVKKTASLKYLMSIEFTSVPDKT